MQKKCCFKFEFENELSRNFFNDEFTKENEYNSKQTQIFVH